MSSKSASAADVKTTFMTVDVFQKSLRRRFQRRICLRRNRVIRDRYLQARSSLGDRCLFSAPLRFRVRLAPTLPERPAARIEPGEGVRPKLWSSYVYCNQNQGIK